MTSGLTRFVPAGPIAGVGLGGACGGLVTATLNPSPRQGVGGVSASAVLTLGWAAGFVIGAWVALIGAVYLGEVAKRALEPGMGWYPGLVLGSGLGGALGGVVAGVVGRASIGAAYGDSAQ